MKSMPTMIMSLTTYQNQRLSKKTQYTSVEADMVSIVLNKQDVSMRGGCCPYFVNKTSDYSLTSQIFIFSS